MDIDGITPAIVIAVATAIVGTAGIGGILGALLTHKRGMKFDMITALSARLTELEQRRIEEAEAAARSEREKHELWTYCRKLLDFIYIHKKPDSPDPPPLPEQIT